MRQPLRRWFADDTAKDAFQQALRRLEALLSGFDTTAVDIAWPTSRLRETRRAPSRTVMCVDYVQAVATHQTLLAFIRGEAAAGAAQNGRVLQAVADAAG